VIVASFHYKINLHAFLRTVARSYCSVLLLDYDGTLAPFRTERNRAVPYPGVTELLNKIMGTGRTRVAFITGRRAQELMPLLRLSRQPEIWGSHGLERLHSSGRYELREIEPPANEAIFEADEWIRNLQLEDRLEHKPGSVAVHWRGLPDSTAREIRQKVLPGWSALAQRARLSLEDFDGGLELRTAVCNKVDAVRAVLDEVEQQDAPVAYLGDDAADERVFRSMEHRGLSVLVRPKWRATVADLWLRPPEQLIEFLRDWLVACRGPYKGHGLKFVTTTGENCLGRAA